VSPEATPPTLVAALASADGRDLHALHGCVDWRLSAAPGIAVELARYDLPIGFAALAQVVDQLERDAVELGAADLAPLADALAGHRSVSRATAPQDTLVELQIPPLVADAPEELRRYFDVLAQRAATLAEVWVVQTADRRLPMAVVPGSGLLVLPLSTRAYRFDRPTPTPLAGVGPAPEVLGRLVDAAKNGSPRAVARLIDWPLCGAPSIAAAVLASGQRQLLTAPAAGLAELEAAARHPELALDVVAELEETLAGATRIVQAPPEERHAALDALRIPPLPDDVPTEIAAAFDRLRTRAEGLTDAWVVVGPASRRTYLVAPDTGLAVVRVD
jgi:hypothetical protein